MQEVKQCVTICLTKNQHRGSEAMCSNVINGRRGNDNINGDILEVLTVYYNEISDTQLQSTLFCCHQFLTVITCLVWLYENI